MTVYETFSLMFQSASILLSLGALIVVILIALSSKRK